MVRFHIHPPYHQGVIVMIEFLYKLFLIESMFLLFSFFIYILISLAMYVVEEDTSLKGCFRPINWYEDLVGFPCSAFLGLQISIFLVIFGVSCFFIIIS